MSKPLFREGLRRTAGMGFVLAAAFGVLGVLSILYGQDYMLYASILAPYVPIPVLIYLMRYLNKPAAVDFYGTLPMPREKTIISFIRVTQIHVWICIALGVVPFFIKDAIRPEVFSVISYHGEEFYKTAFAIQTLIGELGMLFAKSLLTSGITLIIIAVARSSIVQFSLASIVYVLPTFLSGMIDQGLQKLFINIGDSYYYTVSFSPIGSEIKEVLWKLLESAGVLILALILIGIGIKAIEILRRIDVDNHRTAHRWINAAINGALGFCLFLVAGYAPLQHIINSVFVSFHGEASEEAFMYHIITGDISLLGKFPWLPFILYLGLGLGVTLILTWIGCRKKKKKWIDFLLSLAVLVLISALSFGYVSLRFARAIRPIEKSKVGYVQIEKWYYRKDGKDHMNVYDLHGGMAVLFLPSPDTDDEAENARREEERKNYQMAHALPDAVSVMTEEGALYSNLCEGNLGIYIPFEEVDDSAQLDEDVWFEGGYEKHNEQRNLSDGKGIRKDIMMLLLDAANENASIIRQVLKAGKPVMGQYNGGYFVVNIHMENGATEQRRVYLTESDQERIESLLHELSLPEA